MIGTKPSGKSLPARLHYAAGDAGKPGGLEALQKWLKQAEGNGPGSCLFYLSVAPELYTPIANNLSATGLNHADAAGLAAAHH